MRLTFIVTLAFLAPAAVRAEAFTCQPASPKSSSLRTRAIGYELSPDYAQLRADLSVTSTDTAQVVVVAVDSVCDAVTKAVNAASTSPQSNALIVVQFGNFFAACVADSSSISSVFILDDHYVLKTVLIST